MTSPIKTAIVGFGSVAEKMHAPLIDVCPDLELVASVERRTNRCEELYPSVTTFRSLDELLEADVADLIVITTPNEFHFPMAMKCLNAGKHVVVDKPVTIFSHEAEKLDKLAEEKGLICSVFQNRRYDGDFMTLQKLVRQGDLGDLVYLESHFDRFRPEVSENWREKEVPGNGITFDLGSHLIDQVVLLFGLPNWIQADIRKQRTGAVADDYFDIILDYGSLKAKVTAGALVNVPTPKFLLLGKNGSYQKFGLDVQEAAFKLGHKPEGQDWGVESEERWGKIFHKPEGQDWGVESEERWGKIFLSEETKAYETIPGNYRILYQNVADAISKGATLDITIPQTISVLKIIEASFESSKSGNRITKEKGGW